MRTQWDRGVEDGKQLLRVRVPEGGPLQDGERLPTGVRQKEEFLKGPIPLPWLAEAAKLPGRALAVGLSLWWASGVRRTREVPLTTAILRRFGIDRWAKYHGLAALEGAGLVKVVRPPRRNPVVTILGQNDRRTDDEASEGHGCT